MTTRNHRIRFCDNNIAASTTSAHTYSSELSGYPGSNSLNQIRAKVWKPSGHFLIDSTNNKIYINDGTDKTITLTSGSYTTPALLATHITTQLNASSSGWTVTHNASAGEYKFRFAHASAHTLRFSQTSNAAWNTIGFTGSVDTAIATYLDADEQRNHTEEYAIYDLGYAADVTFFAMIAPLNEELTFSDSAVVKIQGNNVNSFTSPPLDLTVSKTVYGYMRFNDDQTSYNYRYWKVSIVDKTNPLGPTGLKIGYVYLGDYFTMTLRNVARGFSKEQVDPSEVSISEGGSLYFDVKTKYNIISNISLLYMDRDEKDSFVDMFDRLGKTTSFFVSLDPTLVMSNSLGELTKYVVFNEHPKLEHVINDYFTVKMSFRELI